MNLIMRRIGNSLLVKNVLWLPFEKFVGLPLAGFDPLPWLAAGRHSGDDIKSLAAARNEYDAAYATMLVCAVAYLR
jgi:hypothetical protein